MLLKETRVDPLPCKKLLLKKKLVLAPAVLMNLDDVLERTEEVVISTSNESLSLLQLGSMEELESTVANCCNQHPNRDFFI